MYRSRCLSHAKRALYHLSYYPIFEKNLKQSDSTTTFHIWQVPCYVFHCTAELMLVMNIPLTNDLGRSKWSNGHLNRFQWGGQIIVHAYLSLVWNSELKDAREPSLVNTALLLRCHDSSHDNKNEKTNTETVLNVLQH